uniref:Uncharacterized protein n=1 Tax=Arundo donax TaxID=35708 RepID=A0A0A9FBE2_ARUDO
MMSQRWSGACSALRMSRMSEASCGSWSSATRTSSSVPCTGMYTLAILPSLFTSPSPPKGAKPLVAGCSVLAPRYGSG